MNEMLRKRMSATQQASEQQTGDAAYEQIFQMPVPQTETQFRDVPISKLRPFFTADIGFHPYPLAKQEAFSEELKENGLYERILVRPIAGTDEFEILAGHNRTAAAKLAGWTDIPATVMAVNDQRAISIAIATNLLRRQDLTIIERGKAYQALLDARNRCGQRNAAVETFGDNRQRYNARKIVAEFFGVTEYEIRKAVKLAQLIPPLAEIVENEPKKLNLACADLIADYDESAQTAFIEMCQIDGYALNKQTMAFNGWCRMFGSMCLLMATNVMFVKMLLSVLSYYPSGLDVLPWMVLVVTIVKVAKKADSILARIGLNPAMTGDPLGRGFPGAMTMMVVRSLLSNAAHTIGRNGHQPRSGSGKPKPSAPTGPRTGGGNTSNVNAPSHANGYPCF